MVHRLLAVAGLFSITFPAYADGPKKPADPAVALIDRLEQLGTQDTGYSGSVSGSSFLPLGHRRASVVLLSPSTPSGKSDAMLSLVKLGAKAVPALLDHLDDDRKTKIVIRNNLFGFFGISQDEGEKAEDEQAKGKGKAPVGAQKQYTLRVGDLCYVALGQIVNRNYTAVQYIPSGNVMITSVPHSKKLRADLKKQWGGLTEGKHLESLVKDLNSKKAEGGDDGTRVGAASGRRCGWPITSRRSTSRSPSSNSKCRPATSSKPCTTWRARRSTKHSATSWRRPKTFK